MCLCTVYAYVRIYYVDYECMYEGPCMFGQCVYAYACRLCIYMCVHEGPYLYVLSYVYVYMYRLDMYA
jgi:hypothetical protein